MITIAEVMVVIIVAVTTVDTVVVTAEAVVIKFSIHKKSSQKLERIFYVC
jgi:hypothetical protein